MRILNSIILSGFSFFFLPKDLIIAQNQPKRSSASIMLKSDGDPILKFPLENSLTVPLIPYNGDTLPLISLSSVDIVASRTYKSEKERLEYLRLVRDVRKAYPYAVIAAVKLRKYDAILTEIPEKERSPYLKQTEKELKTQFEVDLKNLTVNQGRILIRLINRETGKTTFNVIKNYRGRFTAFLWQSFSILWGNNLKWKYDPTQGEDKLIENIILQIQDGDV